MQAKSHKESVTFDRYTRGYYALYMPLIQLVSWGSAS